jgi:hypothetical protein
MQDAQNEKINNYLDVDRENLVQEIIEKRLGEQISSVDTFATRAGLILATNGIVFAAYTQLVSNRLWLINCGSVLFVPEIALVALSGFFAFTALAIGGEKGSWYYDPDPEKLYRLSKDKSNVDLRDEIIRSMVDAYNKNAKTFKEKFELLSYAKYALYGSGLIFLIHLLIFFF